MSRHRALKSGISPPVSPLSPAPAGDEPELASKTRRKNRMHALQDLGERLAELRPEQLAQFGLPEDLATAIADYRRFTKWEAKRRQMQYIGRLMRDIDPAPIAAKLDQSQRTSREAVASFHAAESWRDRLVEGADSRAALEALIAAHPHADREKIAKLADQARAERAAGRPPASVRLLFRELSRLLASGANTETGGE
jgi:ribosome-associated protein